MNNKRGRHASNEEYDYVDEDYEYEEEDFEEDEEEPLDDEDDPLYDGNKLRSSRGSSTSHGRRQAAKKRRTSDSDDNIHAGSSDDDIMSLQYKQRQSRKQVGTPQQNQPGYCHNCKRDRSSCIICPNMRTHRFCNNCVSRHFSDSYEGYVRGDDPWIERGGCPICFKECPCAACKRREANRSKRAGNSAGGRRGRKPKGLQPKTKVEKTRKRRGVQRKVEEEEEDIGSDGQGKESGHSSSVSDDGELESEQEAKKVEEEEEEHEEVEEVEELVEEEEQGDQSMLRSNDEEEEAEEQEEEDASGQQVEEEAEEEVEEEGEDDDMGHDSQGEEPSDESRHKAEVMVGWIPTKIMARKERTDVKKEYFVAWRDRWLSNIDAATLQDIGLLKQVLRQRRRKNGVTESLVRRKYSWEVEDSLPKRLVTQWEVSIQEHKKMPMATKATVATPPPPIFNEGVSTRSRTRTACQSPSPYYAPEWSNNRGVGKGKGQSWDMMWQMHQGCVQQQHGSSFMCF